MCWKLASQRSFKTLKNPELNPFACTFNAKLAAELSSLKLLPFNISSSIGKLPVSIACYPKLDSKLATVLN